MHLCSRKTEKPNRCKGCRYLIYKPVIMSDFKKNWMSYIVGTFVAIGGILILGTIIFGDNSCSEPKYKETPVGAKQCKTCRGTGYNRSNKRSFGIYSYYDNTKCPRCSGKGYYYILTGSEDNNSDYDTSPSSNSTPSSSSSSDYYPDIQSPSYPATTYPDNYENRNSEYSAPSKQLRYYTEEETCPICHGTRTCNTCGGKGYYFVWGTGKDAPCPNCKNQNGRCSYCDGRGTVTKQRSVYE